jgi:hypothetical protein
VYGHDVTWKEDSRAAADYELDFEEVVLRRTVLELYDGEFPTVKKLALELRNKINYRVCVSSVYKISKTTWFKYRKTNYGRKFLTAHQIEFLRRVYNLKISPDQHSLFYSDEIWVKQNQ